MIILNQSESNVSTILLINLFKNTAFMVVGFLLINSLTACQPKSSSALLPAFTDICVQANECLMVTGVCGAKIAINKWAKQATLARIELLDRTVDCQAPNNLNIPYTATCQKAHCQLVKMQP